jgi:digeranylgeranylglycerophospholipid reductase
MERLTPKVSDADKVYCIDKKYQTVQHTKISFIAPNGWNVSTPFDSFSMDRASWTQDLVSSSENAGVRIFRNTRAIRFNGKELIIRQGAHLSKIRAKVFVAADGVNSLFSRKQEQREIAWCRQHIVENLGASYDPNNVLMFFGSQYAPGAYAWIIPKTKEMANVGLGVRRQYLNPNNTPKAILENLWKHPVAKEVLGGSQIVSSVSASVPVGLPLKSTVQNRVLFVGDSASQIISHVGAGIPPAMVTGRDAAKAIASYLTTNEPLQAYDQAWRKKLLSVMKTSYKLRQIWDKISSTDSRMQWYLKRLSKGDLESVVHVEVPLKLRIGGVLIPLANIMIR